MPENDTDVEVTESSTVESQDVNSADSSGAETQDVTPATSSPAEGEKELTAFDVVEKALSTEEPPASEKENGEAEQKAEEPKKPEAEDKLPEDPTEEELKNAAPTTRKRIEQLLDTRKGLQEQVASIEPKARQWDQIEEFRKANGMQPQHVANAIQIAALIETDPSRAYQVVDQLHRALAERTGESLPTDLRDAVKRGEITRDRAFELSRAQAKSQTLSAQRQADAVRQDEDRQETDLRNQVASLGQTATAWDQAKLTSDPDWHLKRDDVAQRMQLRLQNEGFPQTAEAMRGVLEEEAKAVDAFVGRFRPAARTVVPTPPSASSRGETRPAPKDHYEVIDRALGG